jgi:hypothetical protein
MSPTVHIVTQATKSFDCVLKLQVRKTQLCLLVRSNGPRRSMRRLNEIEDNAL